jgi:hypothetical protein
VVAVTRQPWLIVWVDRPSGLAEVRGIDAERACRLVTDRVRRSRRGPGWVVPAECASDLAALGQCYRDLVVLVDRKAARS